MTLIHVQKFVHKCGLMNINIQLQARTRAFPRNENMGVYSIPVDLELYSHSVAYSFSLGYMARYTGKMHGLIVSYFSPFSQ